MVKGKRPMLIGEVFLPNRLRFRIQELPATFCPTT